MDLASYLNISLKPIVESAEKTNERLRDDKEMKDYHLQTISQLERHQPSVIKEEDEHENEEFEENTVNLRN